MIISGSKFRAFVEHDLMGVFEGQKHKIKEKVRGNENDADIDQLVSEFTVHPIVFNESGITISDREEMIPARMFPSSFWPDAGRSYPKPVVRYHLPFSGDRELFRFKPSAFVMRTEEITLEGDEVCFDVVNWSGDVSQVKREVDGMLQYLRDQNANVTTEIQKHNDGLRAYIVAAVAEAKNKNQRNDDFISSLGVPRKPNG